MFQFRGRSSSGLHSTLWRAENWRTLALGKKGGTLLLLFIGLGIEKADRFRLELIHHEVQVRRLPSPDIHVEMLAGILS